LDKLLKNAFVSVDEMDKFVILRTLPGNASAVANLIDKRFKEELFGTLNDDDNILMIARTQEARSLLFNELKKYNR
jgi:transcriptional regulator of arginine metabolism